MTHVHFLGLLVIPWLAGCASSSFASVPPSASAPLTVHVEHPDGRPLETHTHRGLSFVAAREGTPYRIRLENHRATRVEVLLSVDGRDVISGTPAQPGRQRGYVVEPFGSVLVQGYRQSLDYVAAFQFVAPHQSYATTTGGDGSSHGHIQAAVFLERPTRRSVSGRTPLAAPSPRPAEVAPATSSARSDRAQVLEAAPSPSPSSSSDSKAAADEAPGLATGWGSAQVSVAQPVRFRRLHRYRPDAVIEVFYDAHGV